MNPRALSAMALIVCCATASASEDRSSDRHVPTTAQLIRSAVNGASPTPPRRPELTRAFWDCDYEATRTMLNAGEAADCSAATEALLQEFDGDFRALLSWWQRHKAAEHAARERSGVPR